MNETERYGQKLSNLQQTELVDAIDEVVSRGKLPDRARTNVLTAIKSLQIEKQHACLERMIEQDALDPVLEIDALKYTALTFGDPRGEIADRLAKNACHPGDPGYRMLSLASLGVIDPDRASEVAVELLQRDDVLPATVLVEEAWMKRDQAIAAEIHRLAESESLDKQFEPSIYRALLHLEPTEQIASAVVGRLLDESQNPNRARLLLPVLADHDNNERPAIVERLEHCFAATDPENLSRSGALARSGLLDEQTLRRLLEVKTSKPRQRLARAFQGFSDWPPLRLVGNGALAGGLGATVLAVLTSFLSWLLWSDGPSLLVATDATETLLFIMGMGVVFGSLIVIVFRPIASHADRVAKLVAEALISLFFGTAASVGLIIAVNFFVDFGDMLWPFADRETTALALSVAVVFALVRPVAGLQLVLLEQGRLRDALAFAAALTVPLLFLSRWLFSGTDLGLDEVALLALLLLTLPALFATALATMIVDRSLRDYAPVIIKVRRPLRRTMAFSVVAFSTFALMYVPMALWPGDLRQSDGELAEVRFPVDTLAELDLRPSYPRWVRLPFQQDLQIRLPAGAEGGTERSRNLFMMQGDFSSGDEPWMEVEAEVIRVKSGLMRLCSAASAADCDGGEASVAGWLSAVSALLPRTSPTASLRYSGLDEVHIDPGHTNETDLPMGSFTSPYNITLEESIAAMRALVESEGVRGAPLRVLTSPVTERGNTFRIGTIVFPDGRLAVAATADGRPFDVPNITSAQVDRFSVPAPLEFTNVAARLIDALGYRSQSTLILQSLLLPEDDASEAWTEYLSRALVFDLSGADLTRGAADTSPSERFYIFGRPSQTPFGIISTDFEIPGRIFLRWGANDPYSLGACFDAIDTRQLLPVNDIDSFSEWLGVEADIPSLFRYQTPLAFDCRNLARDPWRRGDPEWRPEALSQQGSSPDRFVTYGQHVNFENLGLEGQPIHAVSGQDIVLVRDFGRQGRIDYDPYPTTSAGEIFHIGVDGATMCVELFRENSELCSNRRVATPFTDLPRTRRGLEGEELEVRLTFNFEIPPSMENSIDARMALDGAIEGMSDFLADLPDAADGPEEEAHFRIALDNVRIGSSHVLLRGAMVAFDGTSFSLLSGVVMPILPYDEDARLERELDLNDTPILRRIPRDQWGDALRTSVALAAAVEAHDFGAQNALLQVIAPVDLRDTEALMNLVAPDAVVEFERSIPASDAPATGYLMFSEDGTFAHYFGSLSEPGRRVVGRVPTCESETVMLTLRVSIPDEDEVDTLLRAFVDQPPRENEVGACLYHRAFVSDAGEWDRAIDPEQFFVVVTDYEASDSHNPQLPIGTILLGPGQDRLYEDPSFEVILGWSNCGDPCLVQWTAVAPLGGEYLSAFNFFPRQFAEFASTVGCSAIRTGTWIDSRPTQARVAPVAEPERPNC